MWRKKTGFNDFLRIVKEMPFLHAGRQYRQYRRWNRHLHRYENVEPELLNVDTLQKYVDTLDKQYKDSYGHYEVQSMSLDEYKIMCLNQWVRARNYNATKEFRNTRAKAEYFIRLEKYENN